MGLGTCYWINSLEHMSPPGFILWQLGFALYFLFFGIFYRILCRRIGYWIIIGAPALWVALEYIRANLYFLSCPWTLLGHSQYLYIPVIQIADITGVYGISFILVMLNQLLSQGAEYFFNQTVSPDRNIFPASSMIDKNPGIITVFILFFIIFYSLIKLAPQDDNTAGSIRVALVQGNVLVDNGMSSEEQKAHLDVYKGLTGKAARQKPDLIVWPATSLPGPPRTNRLVGYTVRGIATSSGTYLLVGGAGYEKIAPKKGYLPFSKTQRIPD